MINSHTLIALLAMACLMVSSARANSDSSCDSYGSAVNYGKLTAKLPEISGLAVSRQHGNLLWGHNDSGDKARIYGFDNRGNFKTRVSLKGLKAVDWEDMAIARCNPDNQWCLYVGDIGDNKRIRQYLSVYRLKEPAPTPKKQTILNYETMHLTYPDARHNAEALFVDNNENVYILTKDLMDVFYLYSAPFKKGQYKLTFHGVVNTSKLPRRTLVTAADYDPFRHRIIVRTYASIFEYRLKTSSAVDSLLDTPWQILDAVKEKQGEAIAYGTDGYWQISEGHKPNLWYFPCQKAGKKLQR